ncbi:MAG TPA: DUF4340 domain-containing protein [Steroidobacteraceae bacterium]|nr:DUF4340 domain-containing protein [Steroidobacteraceae bacterium]
MNRRRFVGLLVAALIAIASAFYLSSRRNTSSESQGTLLLPKLAQELDTVTELSVHKGSTTPSVTVHRAGDQWTVAQRGDYPADVTKVRNLLIALGDAKIIEEKTRDPANFSIIGVEDATQPGATGAELTVSARDGKHALIIGKPVGEGSFARLVGENRSYMVQPALSVDAEPRLWIDSKLIDIPAASIQSLEVKLAGAAGYTLKRLKPNEDGFALDGVPSGRKALEAKSLAPSSTMMSDLAAEDVASASDVDFSKPSEAILTLPDGKLVTLTGAAVGDKRWIRVSASNDAALAAKTQNRAFEIASYRYDSIFRPVDQLLVPKETKTPANPAASSKPAAGSKTAKPATPPKPATSSNPATPPKPTPPSTP